MGNLITEKVFIETDFKKWRTVTRKKWDEHYSKHFKEFIVTRPVKQGWFQIRKLGAQYPILESDDKEVIISYLEKTLL